METGIARSKRYSIPETYGHRFIRFVWILFIFVEHNIARIASRGITKTIVWNENLQWDRYQKMTNGDKLAVTQQLVTTLCNVDFSFSCHQNHISFTIYVKYDIKAIVYIYLALISLMWSGITFFPMHNHPVTPFSCDWQNLMNILWRFGACHWQSLMCFGVCLPMSDAVWCDDNVGFHYVMPVSSVQLLEWLAALLFMLHTILFLCKWSVEHPYTLAPPCAGWRSNQMFMQLFFQPLKRMQYDSTSPDEIAWQLLVRRVSQGHHLSTVLHAKIIFNCYFFAFRHRYWRGIFVKA